MNTEEQQSNSKEWLKEYQYKPGQSGNPNGRPKGESITAKLRKILDQEVTEGKTNADIVAEAIVEASKHLNTKASSSILKELLERTEGKVPDKHEIETGDISIIYKQVKKDE